jgi:hypothetical protein
MKNNLFFMISVSNIPCCGTMTLYNKTPMSVQISLQIGDPKYDATCTADPNSSCTAKTANADYDTIKVGIPNLSNSAWEKEFNGINGQCNYYVSGSDGNYNAQINCPVSGDKKYK